MRCPPHISSVILSETKAKDDKEGRTSEAYNRSTGGASHALKGFPLRGSCRADVGGVTDEVSCEHIVGHAGVWFPSHPVFAEYAKTTFPSRGRLGDPHPCRGRRPLLYFLLEVTKNVRVKEILYGDLKTVAYLFYGGNRGAVARLNYVFDCGLRHTAYGR